MSVQACLHMYVHACLCSCGGKLLRSCSSKKAAGNSFSSLLIHGLAVAV